MEQKIIIEEHPYKPLRDIVHCLENGFNLEAIHTSRELFLTWVHLEPGQFGIYAAFEPNPFRGTTHGVFFIVVNQEIDEIPFIHLTIAAARYCRALGLQPTTYFPISATQGLPSANDHIG